MKLLRFLGFILIFLTAFLLSAKIVQADSITYSNLATSTSVQVGSSFNYFVQTLGNGLSGTLSQIDLNTSNPSFLFYGNRPNISLVECDDSTYGNFTNSESNCITIFSGTSENYSGPISSTQSFYPDSVSLNPLKYYFFTTQGNNVFNSLPYYYGSETDVVDGSCYHHYSTPNTFLPCQSIADLYFSLHGITKTTSGNSSVMFIPGIMSSRLYKQNGNVEDELWLSTADSKQSELSMNASGKSINSIFTKDDIQSNGEEETGILDESFGLNIYKSFIASLRDWKTEGIIPDYAFIPYDWRLSLQDIITNGASTTEGNLSYDNSQNFSDSYILKKLQELQINSPTGKVTIITHSNGGLVAKALIQKLKDTNNPLYNQIDKVIFVAVPQVGTPDAVAALLHGKALAWGLVMYQDRARWLSENMPAIYNLLPSAGYFATVDQGTVSGTIASFEGKPLFTPQTSQYGFFVSNPTELKNYILGTDGRSKPGFSDTVSPNIGNSGLYADAQNIHTVLDNWQPSPETKVIQVAGWGEETIAGLDYKVYKDFFGNDYASYTLRRVVDGDGTVVVPSALWMSTSTPNVEDWWVDLFSFNAPTFNINRKHRDILEVPSLLDFIKSKITNNTFSDPDNIVVDSSTGLISTETRLHYTLHSPLTLGVIDSQGRYTGLDPTTKEVREEIPDVTYERVGEVQFLSVPSNIAHIIKLKGYETGSFSIDIDKQQGNTITEKTSFQGIPSSASTTATINVPENSTVANSSIQIDQNGDGVIDKTLLATSDGITIYDSIPPELKLIFNLETKDVAFSVVDLVDSNPTLTIATTSITLKDSSGNTTIIPFTKLRDIPTRLRLTYNKIIRNGITITIPNTNIVCDWQEKKGLITDLDTKVTIKGVEKYVFSYKKTNNVTIIKEKKDTGLMTTTKPGFVIVAVQTNNEGLTVSY